MEQNYADSLRKGRDEAQVAFQTFMLSTKQKPLHLFCFFEGKDNDYYVSRIRPFHNEIEPILCGGRDKVLRVYELITHQLVYDKYKKAFFIDRDFNLPLPPKIPPIFETPCYAIENFYSSIEAFEHILTNFFHLSEVSNEADYRMCLQLFKDRQQEFHEAMTLFNAWYACLIDIRNAEGKKTGVNLDEKLPKGFINITLEVVTQQYDIEKIRTTFPDALPIDNATLQAKIAYFDTCNKQQIFRGKYEMEFLLKMLFLLVDDSKKGKQKYVKKPIDALFVGGGNLNNAQGLNILSSYADTPQELKDYLASL